MNKINEFCYLMYKESRALIENSKDEPLNNNERKFIEELKFNCAQYDSENRDFLMRYLKEKKSK